MEREGMRNPPDHDIIDQYLSGELPEEEEESFERTISSSWRAANRVSQRANIAGRLTLLNPAAHQQAYREEAVRAALTRLRSSDNLALSWKERLGAWMREMFVCGFPVVDGAATLI